VCSCAGFKAVDDWEVVQPVAPAGGAEAAGFEGGELACPSAAPHLSVVGVRNPVVVPSLAR
jgi:hypothetical protein